MPRKSKKTERSKEEIRQPTKRRRPSTPPPQLISPASTPTESQQESLVEFPTASVSTTSNTDARYSNEESTTIPLIRDESLAAQHTETLRGPGFLYPNPAQAYTNSRIGLTVNEFLTHCYDNVYKKPDKYVIDFYSEESKLLHENDNMEGSCYCGIDQIKNRIRELNFKNRPIKRLTVHHDELANGIIAVLVHGEIQNENNQMKKFVQAFTLKLSSNSTHSYYISADIFRYHNFPIFFDEPELFAPEKFDLRRDINVNRTVRVIAENAKYLIQQLKLTPKEFSSAYQIEIQEKGSGTYEMFLRINPVQWYQSLKLLNDRVASDCARKYINKISEECRMDQLATRTASLTIDKIKQIRKTERLNKQCSVEKWKGFCEKDSTSMRNHARDERRGGDVIIRSPPPSKRYKSEHRTNDEHYMFCDEQNMSKSGLCPQTANKEHNTDSVHFFGKRTERNMDDSWRGPTKTTRQIPLPLQCRHPIRSLDQTSRYCLFYADPDYEIYRDEIESPSLEGYPYFFVGSRNHARPVVTLHPIKHATQTEYVQSIDAWRAVLKTLTKIQRDTKSNIYPLQRIFINFGEWMSQREEDPDLYNDCHAHINIHLKPEIIEACSKDVFPTLVGAKLETTNYRYNDAVKKLGPLVRNH